MEWTEIIRQMESRGSSDVAAIPDRFAIGNLTFGVDIATFPFKSDFYACCVCEKGEMRGRVNLAPYTLTGPGLLATIPGQLLEHVYISPDFKGVCLFMTREFVGGLGLPYNFNVYMSVQSKSVLPLNEEQYAALLTFCKMARRVIRINHPNKEEVIRHLTCAFFYGMGTYFYNVDGEKRLSNKEAIARDFLNHVRQNFRKERKVTFYADKMHLSAGYLSAIVKAVSGRSAAEWIDDYVVLEAKALLKQTSQTIQQVSYSLNFPSQSFFGKYFKAKTGLTPKAYQKSR